jgi:rhodanese-related sulfurtransferase
VSADRTADGEETSRAHTGPHVRPEVAAKDRHIRLVDIRGRAERSAGIGYIPGSRLFPADLLRADVTVLSDAYPMDTPIALVCQSGRRAEEMCSHLQAAGFTRVAALTGGILGWRAAGLPTCAVDPPDPGNVPVVPDIRRFPRVLVACFLASTVEHASEVTWDGRDPMQTVSEILAEEQRGAPTPTPAALERTLDRLGELARLRGFPLDVIRTNLDLMSAALRELAPPSPAPR